MWKTIARCLLLLMACVAVAVPRRPRPPIPARPAQSAMSAAGQSSAQPLAGVTVCLDAGHGGYDGGARGRESGVWEKALNLMVAQRLEALLAQSGCAVVMTRADDTAPSGGTGDTRKRRELSARVGKAENADIFISIHMNEYRDASQSGPQVFFRKGQTRSQALAKALQEQLNLQLAPKKPRSVNTGDYYLLRNLSIPAVLVECGFLSNPSDEKRLQEEGYREKIAQAVCDGVHAYFLSNEGLSDIITKR